MNGSILAMCLAIIAFCMAYTVLNNRMPYDDTDKGTTRSGFSLYTDNRTGCQYLATWSGSITPRLDGSGKHVGCLWLAIGEYRDWRIRHMLFKKPKPFHCIIMKCIRRAGCSPGPLYPNELCVHLEENTLYLGTPEGNVKYSMTNMPAAMQKAFREQGFQIYQPHQREVKQ